VQARHVRVGNRKLMREGGMSEKRGGVFGIILSLSTLSIAVFGAAIGYLEFQDAQQRERVERVFRYADQLAGLAAENAEIDQLAEEFNRNWKALVARCAQPAEFEHFGEHWMVDRIENSQALRGAISQMSLFYDTLAVCVSEGLCDEPTAKALFTQHVAGFASTVHPWVANRNKEYFNAAGIPALCLRARFCGGVTECDGIPTGYVSCSPAKEDQQPQQECVPVTTEPTPPAEALPAATGGTATSQ
jgi:hypothetical protein